MVAMNSIPQQEVANGKGQIEFLRASPTAFSSDVAKNPGPSIPAGECEMSNLLRFGSSIAIVSVLSCQYQLPVSVVSSHLSVSVVRESLLNTDDCR
jgi:hypothetical protein